MLLNKNKQLKYFNLNTNDKTDGTKWNIPTNYNFSQKAKMALVSINNATDSNLNMVFCPTIKNNYFSSLNTSPLIYAGVGYNNQNIINEKQYYDVNGAYLSEIELKTFSSAPQNDLDYNYPQIPNLSPDVWYKFNGDLKESLGNTALDFAPYANVSAVNKNEVSLFNSCIKTAGEFPLRTLWNTTGLTFSFWIYFNSIEGASEPILSFYSNTNSSTSESWYYVRLTKLSTNNIFFQVRSGQSPGNTGFTTPIAYPLNTWHHISWSFLPSSVWNIYINGELINDTTNRTIANVTWHNFFIGRSVGPDSINTAFATQKIKDFRFYKKVLTQNEVSILATNYFSETDARRLNYPIIKNEALKLANPADNDPNIHTTPIIWYKFDDSTNIGLDSMGKANLVQDGAIAMLTYDNTTSVRGIGSLKYDNSAKTLKANYDFSDINDAMTVSFWLKINGLNTTTGYDVLFYGNKLQIGRQSFTNDFKILFLGSQDQINIHFNGEFIADNKWKYMTLTIEKSITAVKITSYLNGIFNATFTNGTWDKSGIISFKLGLNVNPLNGNLDDMRFYNKVLDQEEITRIYNGAKTNYTTPITEPTIGMDLDPIIWYKFDNSSNIGLDSMGKANAIQEGTTPIPTYDNTTSIRGSGSVKSVAGQKLLTTYNFSDIIDAFTISFWVKINALGGSYDSIVAGSTGANQGLFYICRGGGGSNLEILLFGSSSIVYTGLYVADNIWKYLTITAEKLGTSVKLNLYLNGIYYSTTTSGTWSLSGLTGFNICNQYSNGTTLLGNLDDMRIYNRVLSQTQITELYQNNNYYILPTTENKYNTNPSNTQYQLEVKDEEQKIISHY